MKFTVSHEPDRVVYSTGRHGAVDVATVIVADAGGIQITRLWGPLRRELDLEDFIVTLRKAWAHHEFLQRNIVGGAELDEPQAQRTAANRAAYSAAQLARHSVGG